MGADFLHLGHRQLYIKSHYVYKSTWFYLTVYMYFRPVIVASDNLTVNCCFLEGDLVLEIPFLRCFWEKGATNQKKQKTKNKLSNICQIFVKKKFVNKYLSFAISLFVICQKKEQRTMTNLVSKARLPHIVYLDALFQGVDPQQFTDHWWHVVMERRRSHQSLEHFCHLRQFFLESND